MSTLPTSTLSNVRDDAFVTGVISAQNTVPAGVAPANSAVVLDVSGGFSTVSIQTVGTYTGALSIQGTVNGTNWITFGGSPFMNAVNGAVSATIASATQGIFSVEVTAMSKVRITALAAVTGSVAVTMRAGTGTSLVGLDASIPAGSSIIGAVTQSGAWTMTLGTPTASLLAAAATTNATVVKATAGTLFNVVASNSGATTRYLKYYNKATAPTVGTDVPALVIPLVAGHATPVGFGTLGTRLSLGIGMAITSGAADNDATGVAAGEVKVCTSFL